MFDWCYTSMCVYNNYLRGTLIDALSVCG